MIDERLAHRIREALRPTRGIAEKRMFGGLAFLHHGNMCVGIVGEDLMVRVGPDAYDEALARPHARPMDFTGKPMRGFVYIGAQGIRTKKALGSWIERGLAFSRTLPRK